MTLEVYLREDVGRRRRRLVATYLDRIVFLNHFRKCVLIEERLEVRRRFLTNCWSVDHMT